MTISSGSITNRSSVEQELGDILQLLNPPQQDYDLLADELFSLWSDPRLPPTPSIERVLAGYFGLFALGYDKWQGCYDYPRIHEHFYGAYLQAIQEGSSCLSPQVRAMLEQMTHAFIAYTGCENALICNDPKGLLDSATRANECGTAARESLAHSSLGQPLSDPIMKYLEMNIELWTGFKLCAEMYLDTSENKQLSSAMVSEVHEKIESLTVKSRELASELRAHFSFAQRLAQAHAQRSSDLRVKEGTLLLRASGHVGEVLTAKMFNQFANTSTVPENIRKAICENTGLPIVSVRPESMQDIFETSLGKDYLEQIIFELSTDKGALTFFVNVGKNEVSYSVKTFQVRLTHFGTISVEFEIYIEDASVSHVRVLESLITPYTGRFDFTWRDAPQDIRQGSTNYVDCFLRSKKWLKSIRDAMPGLESGILTEMEKVLTDWEKALCELARWLHPGFTEPLNGTSEQAKQPDGVYQTLHENYFIPIRDLAHRWIKGQESSTSSPLEKIVEVGKSLFPPGDRCVRFELLMDIAEVVVNRIINYFSPEKDGDVRHLFSEGDSEFGVFFSFDRNTGWATILLCNSLIIERRDGRKIEPTTESDHYRVAAHPEFKGLIIQPREARSGLDDWLFVAMPAYRNLATIRSHETDAMYTGENHTFLYLPDDPQFLTEQYLETVRLVDDLRILVLSFNAIAKEQIKGLESFFYKLERSEHNKMSDWSKEYRSLEEVSEQIEVFRTHVEKILDLLRSTTISRFQDHSELLKEMINESKVNYIRDSLEHNIVDLDRFHAYLTERLRRKMDDRTQTTQRRINYMVAALTLLSALSVLTIFVDPMVLRNSMISFIELLGGIIGRNILLLFRVVLLVAVLLGSIAASLIARKRSRKT